MNNFLTRVVTAIFFGIVFISGIYYNEYTLTGLFAVVLVVCMMEFNKLIFQHAPGQNDHWSVIAGLVLFLTVVLTISGLSGPDVLAINIPFFAFIFIKQLYSKYDRPFRAIAYKLSSLVYLAFPLALFCSLGFIHQEVYNHEITLGFMFLLWANDSGAYLIGMSLGKNKLFERISPKKSWEGFFGGLVVAIGVAVLCSLFFTTLAVQHWIVMAILVTLFGTFGDLVESMFKRSMNVKDSGKLLPGHGGFLDRFDGLLIAAPMVYSYLVLFS
jgi:phosphatidate cytidylyltransferase